MRPLFLLILLFLAAAPDADSILQQLSSDDFKERQAAERDLVRQGESALPVIEELLKKATDAEARARLEGALKQIENARKDGPSHITLHLKDAHPREVMAELSKQAYAPMRTYPDNLLQEKDWAKVTIDLDRVPFWDAVRELAPMMGLELSGWNEGLRFMRGAGNNMLKGPAVMDGPFLIVANNVSRSRTIQLNGPQNRSDEFGVGLSAYVEPKITVLRAASMVSVEEAVDDNGNDLIAEGRAQGGYFGGNNGMWSLHARLKYPEKPGKLIARFKGSTTFTVQAQSELIEIPDIQNVKDAAHIVGGIALTVTGIKQEGGNWELGVRITQDALRQQSWAEVQQSMQSHLKIVDAAGLPLDSRGFGSRASNREIVFNLQYALSRHPETGNPSGPPAKLIWRVPTETVERKVSFEFKDLPMP